MFGRVHKALNYIPIAILVSCSRPIDVPPLEKYEPHPVERIVLGRQIGPKEIRELFQAVNSDHKLDDLKPFFFDPSDGELGQLGTTLQAELFDSSELLEIIKLRGRRKGFSDWKQRAEAFKSRPAFPSFKGTFGKILESRNFPELLERDAAFLSPSIAKGWQQTAADSSALHKDDWVKKHLTPAGNHLHQAFLDLETLMKKEKFLAASERLWRVAERERLLDVVTRSLSALTEPGAGDFRTLLGFQVGMADIWDREPTTIHPQQAGNAMEFLVKVAALYAAPSEKLFERLAVRLNENPQLGEPFSQLFRDGLIQGLATPLVDGWKSLGWATKDWLAFADEATKTDGPLFNQLLAKNLEGLKSFSGPLSDEKQEDFLQKNLSNYLLAYLLTDWWKGVVSLPENREKWLSEGLWESELASPEYKLPLVDQSNNRLRFALSERVTLESWKIFYQHFRRWIEGDPSLAARFNVSISAAVGKLTAAPLVGLRLLELEAVAPRIETGEVFRILLARLTGKSFPSLMHFDSDDTLRDIFTVAGALPLEKVRNVEGFLFNDLNLKNISPALQDAVLLIFADAPGEKFRAKVAVGLQALPLIPLLDGPVREELPSPIVTLHSFLSHSASAEMNWTSQAVRWVNDVELFNSHRDDKKVRHDTYPGIKGLLASSLPVSMFYRVGRFPEESAADLQRAVHQALHDHGINFHSSLYLSLAKADPTATATGAMWFATEFLPLLLDQNFLTDRERRWLMEAVSSKRLRGLHEFCFAESRKAYVGKALQLFRDLAQSGELSKVFSLLDLVKHERLREIAAVLRELTDSGELSALLDFALTFQPALNSK